MPYLLFDQYFWSVLDQHIADSCWTWCLPEQTDRFLPNYVRVLMNAYKYLNRGCRKDGNISSEHAGAKCFFNSGTVFHSAGLCASLSLLNLMKFLSAHFFQHFYVSLDGSKGLSATPASYSWTANLLMLHSAASSRYYWTEHNQYWPLGHTASYCSSSTLMPLITTLWYQLFIQFLCPLVPAIHYSFYAIYAVTLCSSSLWFVSSLWQINARQLTTVLKLK